MTSYAKSCFPIALQSVKDAISKDGSGDTKEAYCNYLSCLLFMAQALKDEAWDKQELKDLAIEESFKLFKLTEQCLERAHDILKHQRHGQDDTDRPHKDHSWTTPHPAQRRHSQPPSMSLTPQAPRINRTASNIGGYQTNQPRNSSLNDLVASIPSPPGARLVPTNPSHQSVNNQEMFQAYQRRKSYRGGNIQQKYATANFNLSLFRKEAEKMALSKAREKAIHNKLVEREKQMKFEAERRWNNRQNRSSRDKDYRQNLLASILTYEEDAKWPKTFRDTLVIKKTDTAVIVNIVQAVLICKEHPLAKYLNEVQLNAYQKIKKLLEEDLTRTTSSSDHFYLSPVDSFKKNTQKPPRPAFPKGKQISLDERYKDSEDSSRVLNSAAPLKSPPANSPPANSEQLNSPYQSDLKFSTSDNTYDNLKKDLDGDVVVEPTSVETAFDEMEDEMFSSESENEDNETSTYVHMKSPNSSTGAGSEPCYFMVDGSLDKNSTLKSKNENKNDNYENTLKFKDVKKDVDEKKKESKNSTNTDDSGDYMALLPVQEDVYEELSDYEEYDGDAKNNEGDATKNNGDTVKNDGDTLKKDGGTLKNDGDTLKKDGDTVKKDGDIVKNDMCDELDTVDNDNIYEEIDELQQRARVDSKRKVIRKSSTDLLQLVDTDFLKLQDDVVQDLLFGIDRLHSVLLLTYQELDTPTGRDQSYATLETIFFKPLWPWIMKMFSKLNVYKEEALTNVMRKYKSCEPKEMKIREQFALMDSEDISQQRPYLSAIEEIKQLSNLTCPLEKLECCVRMSKAVCHCVETYYLAKGETKPPSVGCDDLLPIVSYVVLKTRSPQIVSECHAMEEFMHEGYLMGEEGYCLTTLHAAISYLLSLSKDV
ncbi:VPS9 domain-containing protein 1-like [Hydractinia symbiolongicarpus]|uniref:VPS9 domain-containing protein 1-like n=1 Tax=Hydractinia symbiolongicarpus TaxID=13093 RepID=UPI00254B5BFA|nr:VPS9 domain-containing protein 1-like [Hydractinia symbiolongicarpus]